MNDPDLLFSKRENGKIFLQEIFHAALRKCEKQLLLIEKEESPFIQKRKLINSIYSSKMLLGRFLSLYRCYRRSKSNISTDVSKIDIENVFQQTNTSMYSIFKLLKKCLSSNNPKMSRNVKFVDFQQPNFCESRFVTLLQQDFPQDIRNVEFRGANMIFHSKNNHYHFAITLSSSKRLFLSDLHVDWPNINENIQKKIFQNLMVQCQKILDTSNQFLVELNNCIRSIYLHGEVLRVCQIIHLHESTFGYQSQANGKIILICYPRVFSPINCFKLLTDDISGVYLQSCSPICRSFTESDGFNPGEFIIYSLYGMDDKEILQTLSEIHNIIHFSKITSILKRFQNFFTTSSIASLKLVDNNQVIECSIFQVIVFRIGLDFITGDPIVFYCLFYNMSSLLIKSILCPENDCSQYLRAFCAYFFLRHFLSFPFEPHLSAISSSNLLSIPPGRYCSFTFAKSCSIVYDDTGLVPVIRSFSENTNLQSEKILYFNSISPKKLNLRSLDPFFPSAFYDIVETVILNDFMSELSRLGIDYKYVENKLMFSIEPFGPIKFKIKSNYWQLHLMYPDLPNSPSDFSIKIIGRHITPRFVSWLLFCIFKITTFVQALKQVKSSYGNGKVVSKVIIYNLMHFKVEFNSATCLPISLRIVGATLDHIDSKNCEIYKITNPWSNLSINCTAYQSLLLKGYLNSLLKTPKDTYRFGPFLAGFMLPFQKIQQVFLSDSNNQWMVTSVQEGFSFFLIYRRICTLFTIIRSSQTYQFILPHFGNSVILQFAIPYSKFERCKQKYNSAIQVNISQLKLIRDSIEEFFAERETIEKLQFQQPEYSPKPPSPQIIYKGPSYCQYVYCVLDENGLHIISSDNSPKYLKNILSIQIEGRKDRCKFIKFVFNTLMLGSKGNDFLRTLNDINEMPGHLLNWQQSIENDGLNVNLNDKSISMILTTKVGRFFLVVYPDNDNVTLSSEQGFQIEKVSTMNNLKSWFKKFVSDDTNLSVDDNDADPSYFYN